MCLGIPVKIVELKDDLKAIAEFSGVKREIDIRFLPKIKEGDYVILHAGFAIQKVDEKIAEETLRLIAKMKE